MGKLLGGLKELPKCPYCGQVHDRAMANKDPEEWPELAPFLCGHCGEVALLDQGYIRKLSDSELHELKKSPAWKTVLGPCQEAIHRFMSRKEAEN